MDEHGTRHLDQSPDMITAYGGFLVNLLPADAEERESLSARAEGLPAVPISLRAQYDLEMLAVGGFSPLDRFLGPEDYASVLSDMRLSDGTLFPVPVTLPLPEGMPRRLPTDVALTDEFGNVLALLEVEQIYEYDRLREMRAVVGTTDRAHPLVAESEGWPGRYLAGRPRVLDLPRHRLHGSLCRTPAQTRECLKQLGYSRVVAFQTRNPMHRIHEELTKRAMAAVDGALLIHPVVGVTRPGDIDHALRVEVYEVLVRNYYDQSTTLLSLLPLAMRFAGPREAVWHSIIRRNYGATHLIVGRDHAGPGKDSRGEPFYGPYEAQTLAELYAAEVGVRPIGFEELVYLVDEDRYEKAGSIPPGGRVFSISGTQVREEYLAHGKRLPEWFTRPEVAEILRKSAV